MYQVHGNSIESYIDFSENVKLIVKQKRTSCNAEMFLKVLIDSYSRMKDLKDSECSKLMLSNPLILLTVSELKERLEKTKGPISTLFSTFENGFTFWLEHPCHCCKTIHKRICLKFIHFRDILKIGILPKNLFELKTKDELIDYYSGSPYKYEHSKSFYYQDYKRNGVCDDCIITLNLEIKEESLNKSNLLEIKRKEMERQILIEEQKLEEENPQYVVLSCDPIKIEEHNKKANELLKRGYHLWGHPTTVGNQYMQTFVREDVLSSKQNAMKTQNKKKPERKHRIVREFV